MPIKPMTASFLKAAGAVAAPSGTSRTASPHPTRPANPANPANPTNPVRPRPQGTGAGNEAFVRYGSQNAVSEEFRPRMDTLARADAPRQTPWTLTTSPVLPYGDPAQEFGKAEAYMQNAPIPDRTGPAGSGGVSFNTKPIGLFEMPRAPASPLAWRPLPRQASTLAGTPAHPLLPGDPFTAYSFLPDPSVSQAVGKAAPEPFARVGRLDGVTSGAVAIPGTRLSARIPVPVSPVLGFQLAMGDRPRGEKSMWRALPGLANPGRHDILAHELAHIDNPVRQGVVARGVLPYPLTPSEWSTHGGRLQRQIYARTGSRLESPEVAEKWLRDMTEAGDMEDRMRAAGIVDEDSKRPLRALRDMRARPHGSSGGASAPPKWEDVLRMMAGMMPGLARADVREAPKFASAGPFTRGFLKAASARPAYDPAQLEAFRKAHGTAFDPLSRMDRGKMRILLAKAPAAPAAAARPSLSALADTMTTRAWPVAREGRRMAALGNQISF